MVIKKGKEGINWII